MDDYLEQWVSDETKIMVLCGDIARWEAGSLAEVRGHFEQAWLDIPGEFRDAAKIEFDPGDTEYGDPITFEIFYLRPATDKEKEAQRQDARDHKGKLENEARAQYEQLKARFG